ncbi:phosphodiesterase [Streptomyces anulatus]|uniref:phosphodiesterase n=1 Tax=Streptomyces anulatus TaxID=1892 RepID=UPI0004C8096D|nr:phosphodiesterase [Streptomyces anulatus]
MTPSVAHPSDPHLTTGPGAAAPAAGLRAALRRVLALDPLPDCAVITGDLTERGRPDEYAALREVVGAFPLPLHLVAGNHDVPEALVGVFGETRFLGGGMLTSYVVEHPGLTVAVLDSRVAGAPGGRLGPGQLSRLDRALARSPGVPALVCLHHPPVHVGIPFLDAMGLADGPALAEVVAAHPRVARVLAGHVHRPVTASFAGSTVAVAPSTYRQSGLVLREGVPGCPDEPASFLLHLMPEGPPGTAWVTHTVPVGGG